MKHSDFVTLFQRRAGLAADGIVGPNTLAALDRVLPAKVTAIPPHPRFPMDHILGAIEAHRELGVPASVSLAQWALESGYGKSMPPGSNNPFGMKARKNETGPTVTVRTREVYTSGPKKGQAYYIDAPFRKFDSFGHAFVEHGKLLGTAPVYAPARAKLPDLDGYIETMGRIYATDPSYADKIKSIIRTNNLRQYDGFAA